MHKTHPIAMMATVLAVVVWAGGCGYETQQSISNGHVDHAEHEHPPHGPHGGHLVESEPLLFEWVYTAKDDPNTEGDDSDTVTVYVFDHDSKKEMPIAAPSIMIEVQTKDDQGEVSQQQFELKAVDATGDPPAACQFSLQDWKIGSVTNHDNEVTLIVEVDGKKHSVHLEYHAH